MGLNGLWDIILRNIKENYINYICIYYEYIYKILKNLKSIV